MKISSFARRSFVALALVLATPVFAQNVLQPGDPIIASSSSSPGSEGVANAIDGKTTKYLNFDHATDAVPPLQPVGFVVTPSIGVTRVTGMRIQSANDDARRDPKTVILEGSNDAAVTTFNAGNWEAITTINVPAFPTRFLWQSFSFSNFKPYKHYRWTVTETAEAQDCCMQVAEVELIGGPLPPDVTQPGDALIASSSSSPGSEGVANAIDNKTTKYLNFDHATDAVPPLQPVGFVVTPGIGRTVVTGMTIQSANDDARRDPKVVILEGSNDDTVTAFNAGVWEEIETFNVPAFPTRFLTQTFLFDNVKPFKHYRWTVTETAEAQDCCMQVAEVELLGTGAPKDITQPGDPLIASSSSSPGSEGVANAIDNKTTKYLNFDHATDAVPPLQPVGFVVTPSVGPTTVTGMTIQSANDDARRDPKVVKLEGSNDDTITSFNSGTWTMITTLNVPAFPTRFLTQEFYFPNSTAYKHYRWTVTETAEAQDCCMQVAEVELLAVTLGADCTKAAFLAQPVNQPVLVGSQATFNVTVNGPWPLQWARNGTNIPGATSTSFTTDAVTVENSTNEYTVTIVGCETSQVVRAQVFTPSATKSVAVSFTGGGANGAPTKMNDDDVVGVHQQAHWNNATLNADLTVQATPATGGLPDVNLDPPQPLLDSDGNATDITFAWETGGNWGTGTGDTTATDRMLNGLVGRNGPGTPATFTFSNVPAGTHSVLIYAVSPPLQFQRVSYNIGTTTYYMRVMNSDEYNAAPGFYRGSATTLAGVTVGDFIRFDNVTPEAGVITLTTETLDTFDQRTGVNGIQLLLNTGAIVGQPPTITVEPQPVVAAAGATARLSVTATGTGLTYQWRKAGRNISNGGNISGATSSQLVISDFSAADAGVYSVAVFNANGSVISKNASAGLSTYNINDSLVGYWKMDETTGSTVANSAAGATAASHGVIKDGGGTAVNGTFAAGQVANAITMDGSSYIFVTNYPKATKAISGAAWVKIDPAAQSDIAIFRNAQGDMIVSGGAPRIVGQFEVGLTFDPNNGEFRPVATVGIGPNIARATGSTPVSTGAWRHIAFTADGAQMRLYVDGVQVGVVDYLADINPPQIDYISMGAQLNLADPADPASLGFDQATPKQLIGQLDEVAVWNRGLTATEVDLLFDAGTAHNALTTVVVPPPGADPTLTGITRNGTAISIAFSGGRLEASPAVAGAGVNWQQVATTSPYTEQATANVKFFRVVAP